MRGWGELKGVRPLSRSCLDLLPSGYSVGVGADVFGRSFEAQQVKQSGWQLRFAGVWALGSVPLVSCVGSETAQLCSDVVCQQEQTWEIID